jgi:putative NADH-flavin reductase
MKIVVFGASGKVGRLVVKGLLEEGHTVTVFIHKKSPFKASRKLIIVKGDIHNRAHVYRAVKKNSIVVSTLGSWGNKDRDIVSSGTKNFISTMNQEGIKRIVTLTGSDAIVSNDKFTFMQRITRPLILTSPAKKILADAERHLALLENSDLDWTTLRSPVMTRGDEDEYKLTDKRPSVFSNVSRKSVAKAMISLIDDEDYIGKAPYIARVK